MSLSANQLDIAALRSLGRVLVVGMGRSGQEAARLLLELGIEKVVCTDRRKDAPLVEGTEAIYGEHRREDFINSDLVVVSPGVPGEMDHLVAASGHGVPVVGELGLAAAILQDPELGDGPLPMVGVTGTNGKSSTAFFTGQLLEQAGRRPFVGGNLGQPLSEAARTRLAGEDDYDCAVVEVSSYQLERPGPFQPVAGVILNLSPDHLARHGDMQTYAAAKLNLFLRMDRDHLAIVPAEDPWLPASALRGRRNAPLVLTLGAHPGVTDDGRFLCFKGTPDDGELDLASFPLPGAHNRQNLAAAVLLAMGLGARRRELDVSTIRPLPHRMELIHEDPDRNVRWVNDSKATNVDAALVGIAGGGKKQVLLLGGEGKAGADYAPLAAPIRENASLVIAFGHSGPEIAERLRQEAGMVPIEVVPDLEAAVGLARKQVQWGGTVLLSPACASFDQFSDFEQRGRVFAALARGAAPEPHRPAQAQDDQP